MTITGSALYAQSGGVTSVINASAYGFITKAMKCDFIENIYGGYHGITGVLNEELVDFQYESPAVIESLYHTPGAALGSCRRNLPDIQNGMALYERFFSICEAHNIRYFFYNGGNDSMQSLRKILQASEKLGYDLTCIGIPKTVDNDLVGTDNCPGFGSAAKYNMVSILEASMDLASMYRDSTKVFVMETMGRHAGWITASTSLAKRHEDDPPHLILLPEVPFEEDKFLAKVTEIISKIGYCVIAVSEGIRNLDGKFVKDAGINDVFGNTQLGGVGNTIQNLIQKNLKLRTHGSILDYCQRSARHLASRVDVEQAVSCGKHAVYIAREMTDKMVTIVRESNDPYSWSLKEISLSEVIGKEKSLPTNYYNPDNYEVTQDFAQYCKPLVEGEDYPLYFEGLPQYGHLTKHFVTKKLDACPKELLDK